MPNQSLPCQRFKYRLVSTSDQDEKFSSKNLQRKIQSIEQQLRAMEQEQRTLKKELRLFKQLLLEEYSMLVTLLEQRDGNNKLHLNSID